MATNQRAAANQARTTRVLLVDDHPMVRERLAEVIERQAGLTVCGEAEDRLQALEAIVKTRPNLVILDLTLKKSSGIDLIKDIKARWPDLPMLVVSMHDEALHAERAIRAGASGYITKQEATRKILLALETVRKGGIYLSEKMAMRIAVKATNHPRATGGLELDQLSDRELRVFELIGRGRSTREIAAELNLDVRTIETYRARIKDKLQLNNATELLQRAILWVQGGGSV